jgi:phenylalanyl-tRNA synthetase beta subunit
LTCRRVAKFLGKELSDEQVTGLATHLDFDTMKNNAAVNKETCECKELLL